MKRHYPDTNQRGEEFTKAAHTQDKYSSINLLSHGFLHSWALFLALIRHRTFPRLGSLHPRHHPRFHFLWTGRLFGAALLRGTFLGDALLAEDLRLVALFAGTNR